jgi:cyclic pyranopterin phosphate synthase
VTDLYGRTFKTLRVSITNTCNFGCTYCVDGEVEEKRLTQQLNPEQLTEIIQNLHQKLDFDTIRLTGGEPTLYKELVELVRNLSELNVPLKMTSNGFLLSKMAKQLADAGLESINISLDAIDEVVFEKMAKRKGLSRVLEGIESCIQNGIQVKLNAVIMKGLNDSQVLPLFEYAKGKGISIRYLELMRMGHLFSSKFDDYFYSQNQILEAIARKYDFVEKERTPSATANVWQTTDGFEFGIIANESEPFCKDCDRLRLDMKGHLYGCLSENKSVSISENEMTDQNLEQVLQEALGHKQPVKFTGSSLTMIGIGG